MLAFVFAKIFVEPVIGRAIDFEDGSVRRTRRWHIPTAAAATSTASRLFTRGVQSNIGMGLGVLAFSVAMGALLAVVFCVVYGRTGACQPARLPS